MVDALQGPWDPAHPVLPGWKNECPLRYLPPLPEALTDGAPNLGHGPPEP